MFDDPLDDESQLQKNILQSYDQNPDMAPKHIADRLDCSESYVRETINEYRSRGGPLF